MTNAVFTEIDTVTRQDIFWVVVRNFFEIAKLTSSRFFAVKQIRYLNVNPFLALITDKVDFLFRKFTDSYFITTAEHFQINGVFIKFIGINLLTAFYNIAKP